MTRGEDRGDIVPATLQQTQALRLQPAQLRHSMLSMQDTDTQKVWE